MLKKNKTQLDLFGNHLVIKEEALKKKDDLSKKNISSKVSSKKKEVMYNFNEAVELIKNDYKVFLKLDHTIRSNKKIKDLAFNCAREASPKDWTYIYFLLNHGQDTGHHNSYGANDDEYLTLKIAKISLDNVVYMTHLSSRLKNDVDFFKSLYTVRPKSFGWDYLEYGGKNVTSNKDLIKLAVKERASEIEFMDTSLKTDTLFLAELYDINEEVIEYYDRSLIESKDFLKKIASKKLPKVKNFSSIKKDKELINYEQIKDEIKQFILDQDPKDLEGVLKAFSSLNIYLDYKFNKRLGSPELSKELNNDEDLSSLLKNHYKKVNSNPSETLYREGWIALPPEWEIGEIEGNSFTEFETKFIDVVEKDEEIPEEYFFDENAAPLADSLEGINIASNALLIDVVDKKDPDYGFFAVYQDSKIFFEHASIYIASGEKVKSFLDSGPLKTLTNTFKGNNVNKINLDKGLSSFNSYLFRREENNYYWFECDELDVLSEKIPQLFWEILESIFDEVYYSNNFGTLAKVLGSARTDMWQSSLHCLVCKKGKNFEIMTEEVSV